jgi:hypothetical protein
VEASGEAEKNTLRTRVVANFEGVAIPSCLSIIISVQAHIMRSPRASTTCNFGYSGVLIEHKLLGAVAFSTGEKLDWDAENLVATNCPEAEQYIKKIYRDG